MNPGLAQQDLAVNRLAEDSNRGIWQQWYLPHVSVGHVQAADKSGFETFMSDFGGFLPQILPGNFNCC
jgi:hypothetical protein